MLILILLIIIGAGITFYHLFRFIYGELKVRAIMRLSYQRSFSVSGTFENEDIYLIETIHNKSFIPVFYVDIEFYLYNQLRTEGYEMSSAYVTYIRHNDSAMQTVLSRYHLLPYMKVVRHHKIKCCRRGYYKLDSIGIMNKNFPVYQKSEAELYVYPKLVDIKYFSNPFNLRQGNVLSVSRIITDPFLLSGIRDYQTGDPFNLINFKATAKSMASNIIKVNKLDYSSSRMFMIYINFQKSPDVIMPTYEYDSIMEKALSYAASFINDALKNGYKVGLAANCMMVAGEMKIEFPQVNGLYHIEEILKEIAKIQTRSGMSFTSLMNNTIVKNIRDSEVFIMTIYIDDIMEEKINFLKKLNNTVVVINLGDEIYNEFQ